MRWEGRLPCRRACEGVLGPEFGAHSFSPALLRRACGTRQGKHVHPPGCACCNAGHVCPCPTGHGAEAGQVSVAALRLGKVDVLGRVSEDLRGAGHVGVLTSVAAGAAASSVRTVAGAVGGVAARLAAHRPSQLLRRKPTPDLAAGGSLAADGGG